MEIASARRIPILHEGVATYYAYARQSDVSTPEIRVSLSEKNLYGSFRPTEQVTLAWERTREIATIIDAQVIVFQCPASFLPTWQNIRNLNVFFQGIDRADIDRNDRVLAWEPRGNDWTDELVRDLCAENNRVHCVDPFDRDSVSGGSIYWRLHGRGGYRYRYTDQDLAEIAVKLQAHAEPGLRYVMFNNISSREDALRLLHRSGASAIGDNGSEEPVNRETGGLSM
jgi:uncharacterized protein YecE (DUF72 family)